MNKSAEAFKTISEAANQLDLPQHVLRHWEEVFGSIRPMRRAGGRRYYRAYDIELLSGVKTLLHDERYTTKGVQKIFKDHNAQYVAEIGRKALAGEAIDFTLPGFDDDAEQAGSTNGVEGSHVTTSAQYAPQATSKALKEDLSKLLVRLEKIQDCIDETLLAVDTITMQEDI